MHRFCESLHLLATDMLRCEKQENVAKKKGTRERELLEIHWEFHSFQKRFSTTKGILKIIQQPTCFLCLFLMKKEMQVHKKKLRLKLNI